MKFDLAAVNAELEKADTPTILEWAARVFGDALAMSSSFQSQSVPLLHLVSEHCPALPVLFLDTGFHFPETLSFRDQLADRFGLNLVIVRVDATELAQGLVAPLHLTDPDACCQQRKVLPMRRAMSTYRGWISGIRHDQTANRAKALPVESTVQGFRIHPMLKWTETQVRRYVEEHGLPQHPLADHGYTSIGCAPCTRRPAPGGGLRSGRWADSQKNECGLHVRYDSESESD